MAMRNNRLTNESPLSLRDSEALFGCANLGILLGGGRLPMRHTKSQRDVDQQS